MKIRHFRAMEILVFILLLTSQSASAATSSGASALALAALLAVHSPISSLYHKRVLERLLDGDSNVAFPANQKISVAADAIVCNAGDVDITAHSCKLHLRSQNGQPDRTQGARAVRDDGRSGTVIAGLAWYDL